ncbi:MAG: cupin domain-containing protein [Sphingomonadales bacterium]|nr:cupin domain-containing protein [Sphingomonadales bacterium]
MSEPLPRRIENAATGDRMIILQSPLLGEGDALIFRGILPGGAHGAPRHVHDGITETFHVESGALEILLGHGRSRVLRPGETIVIKPGMIHGFRNALDTETCFVTTADPGAELEKFLRTVYRIGNAASAGTQGRLGAAFGFARAMAETDMVLATIPRWLQRAVRSLAATIGSWWSPRSPAADLARVSGLAR